jgi:Ankyrin repeats (many copies)
MHAAVHCNLDDWPAGVMPFKPCTRMGSVLHVASRILPASVGMRAWRASDCVLVGAGLEALLLEPLPKGQILLHCLTDEQEQLVRPLLAVGMDINAQDLDGNTPLHCAAAGGHASMLRMLLMCNANPNVLNNQGQDALLCAVRAKKNPMVRGAKVPSFALLTWLVIRPTHTAHSYTRTIHSHLYGSVHDHIVTLP